MLKCVFALIVLLHLCEGLKLNRTLSKEIKDRLVELEKLHGDYKLNLTSDTVRFPTPLMNKNAASCVGVFTRELNSLLHNVTVHEDGKHTLQELMGILEDLAPHPENDNICPVKAGRKSLTPFAPYTTFIRTFQRKHKD